jgi:hypothetical protein
VLKRYAITQKQIVTLSLTSARETAGGFAVVLFVGPGVLIKCENFVFIGYRTVGGPTDACAGDGIPLKFEHFVSYLNTVI